MASSARFKLLFFTTGLLFDLKWHALHISSMDQFTQDACHMRSDSPFHSVADLLGRIDRCCKLMQQLMLPETVGMLPISACISTLSISVAVLSVNSYHIIY